MAANPNQYAHYPECQVTTPGKTRRERKAHTSLLTNSKTQCHPLYLSVERFTGEFIYGL